MEKQTGAKFGLDEHRLSVLAAVAAYGVWGVFPLYWKALSAVSSLEVLAHRIFWSFVLMLLVVLLSGRMKEALELMRSRRTFLVLVCTSVLLGLNWLIYIWAMGNGHVLDSSLGYYINPLLNIVFGIIFFKDRPNRLQMISFGIAALGVLCQAVMLGEIPWVAFGLSVPFAIYAVMRKLVDVDSTLGMFWESAIMSVFAVTQLILLWQAGTMSFLHEGIFRQDFMLIFSSVITTFPLIWFAYSAQHLSLMTMGVVQYLTPTGAFLLGVFVFKEQFTIWHFVSFAMIWLAILVYSLDARRTYKLARSRAVSEAA